MTTLSKALDVARREGVGAVLQRARGQLTARRLAPLVAEAKAEYQALVDAFQAKAGSLGDKDVGRYYWYHTIDLGDGLVTPGDYDFRKSLAHFQFPADMRGMRVLDVGSATGFFAFEFERRGATVTSVELPSIADWDMPSGETRASVLSSLMGHHRARTLEELQHLHLDGPFELCHRVLHSKVTRCHSTIYSLTLEKLGGEQFDLIFVGDVLMHIFSPLAGLVALAPLCRGVMVVAQHLEPKPADIPVMLYTGGDKAVSDGRTWWMLNRLCLEQMLKRIGFRQVAVVGRHTGIQRRGWWPYDRAVIHATK